MLLIDLCCTFHAPMLSPARDLWTPINISSTFPHSYLYYAESWSRNVKRAVSGVPGMKGRKGRADDTWISRSPGSQPGCVQLLGIPRLAGEGE